MEKPIRDEPVTNAVSGDMGSQPNPIPDIPDRIGESHGSPGGAESVEEEKFRRALTKALVDYFERPWGQINQSWAVSLLARFVMHKFDRLGLNASLSSSTEFSGACARLRKAYQDFLQAGARVVDEEDKFLASRADLSSPNPRPADSPERLTEAPLVTPGEQPGDALDSEGTGGGVPVGGLYPSDYISGYDISGEPIWTNAFDEIAKQGRPPLDGVGSEVAGGPIEESGDKLSERERHLLRYAVGPLVTYIGAPRRSKNLP